MVLAVQIVTIIFMITFIFIGIWSFIILNKGYHQLRYKNYILEKIENRLSFISNMEFEDQEKDLEETTDDLIVDKK